MHVHPQEFRDLIEAFLSLVENPRFDLRLISDCGGWVCAAMTVRAHGVDGGPPVAVNGMVAVQIRDGQFLQAINSFDYMKFFEDLGILPPGAMLSCLTGVRLRAAERDAASDGPGAAPRPPCP